MAGPPPGGGVSAAVNRAARAASAPDSGERRVSLRTIKRGLGLLRGRLGLCIGVTTISLALAAASLAGPKITRYAIDFGIVVQNPDGTTGNATVLVWACLLVLGLQIFGLVGGYAQGALFNRVGQGAMHDLRRRVFSHMQQLSIGFYERREPGKIIARVTSDIDSINEFMRMVLTGVLQDFLTAGGISVILFLMNWKLALLVHSVLPVIVIVMWAFRRYSEGVFRRIRETVAGISSYLHETVTGIRVIKAFARERVSRGIFQALSEENVEANMRQGRLFGALFPSIQFLGAVSTVMVFWYGGVLMLGGELTVGDAVAFLLYSTMLFEPWRNLGEMAASIQRASVALDRIHEVLDEEPTVRDRPGATPMAPLEREVSFENVCFSYDGVTRVLHDVSFTARVGEVVAIVGPTGAGKSTIGKLICRFYEVEEGRILFDGRDIRDSTLASVRGQVGVVPQDPFLFSGSIRDNIAYGRAEASPEEIAEAALVTRVAWFARDLPQGLDTPVHERGVKLSDGQRQLVSLARAIVSNARILLLDEATSSVDLLTEAVVQAALEDTRRGRVTFVIAHRLATVRKADSIIVLDHGRIVGRGRHPELMGSCDLYRRLYLRRFEDATEEERRALEREAVAGVAAGG